MLLRNIHHLVIQDSCHSGTESSIRNLKCLIVSYLLVTDVSIQLVILQMHPLVVLAFCLASLDGSWNNFVRHHEIVYDDGLNHALYPHAGACAAVPLFTSVWPNVSNSNVERQVARFVTKFVLIHFLPVYTVKSCFCVILFIKFRRVLKHPKSDILASPHLFVYMEQLGSHWTDFN